jgi:glycerol-3-phosphate dehydrogenase
VTAEFDIAVIGGGIVGLAILRRFSMAGLRCVLLERGADILSGASKGNSAILHTGFDAPAGSLELQCIQAGYAEYVKIKDRLNLPLVQTSGLVVAWNEGELAALPGIVEKAHKNGVTDVVLIDQAELQRREPHLASSALGAVLVPNEHIIDPWSAPLAYAHQAMVHGATIKRRSEVRGGGFDGWHWSLEMPEEQVKAKIVVNVAGNFGDVVEAMVRPPPFSIKPRKGQFVVFDKPAASLVHALIMPVPSERTKGVMLFRTVFGNLAVGPTAEDQDDLEDASTDRATLEKLISRAHEIVPDLRDISVTASYAGLRPATEHRDYVIEALKEKQWITVAGIRSTGLSAALGIAQHVASLYERDFGRLSMQQPRWTPVANLADERPRAYAHGGEIICHCEWVTRGEIEAALSGPLPAGDLGGLKRRTRAMMGRCQGFYCAAKVHSLAKGHFHGKP